MIRINVLVIPTLILAGLVPLAAYAQGPSMDGPTQDALTSLRSNAANMVSSLSDSKGITGDQVTASYTDQLTGLSAQQFNTAMVVKARAEQAAWAQMDPTSRALIKNYFAAVH